MMKKAARKDFYMEIRKSWGRFFSILFIVALGVAFFSGIRASEPDMRLSGDSYFDDSELMDIKALGTYGVTEADVEAMGELEGVELAEGAYSGDYLYTTDEEQRVLHVMSLQEHMNQVAVSEGRLPEKAGECLADDFSDYKIGDTITLESGTDDDISDTLSTDTLEVVGLGNSPCYLSYGRGSATVGDGNITAFLVVPEETFSLDTYTEVYLQVEGAKGLMAFTDAYDDRIEEVQEKAEDLTDERAILRRQELVDEATEELDEAKAELADGEKEYEDGKKKAKEELAKALKEIEDGEAQLADAKVQISDGKKQIESAKKTLDEKQKELDSARKEYKSGKKELEKGQKAYQSAKKEFDAAKKQAEAEMSSAMKELEGLQSQIAQDEKSYTELTAQIGKLKDQLSAGSQGKGENTENADASDDLGMTEAEQEQLKQQIAELEKNAQMLQVKIEKQKEAYQSGISQAEAGQKELAGAEKKLSATKKQLSAAEKKLKSAAAQIQSGQKQIDDGYAQLEAKEKELADGEKEIAANEKKLKEGRQEYEDGKKKTEEELADAKKELDDAKQEIADAEEDIKEIELPKWYVYDRSTLIEYNGFGENAERLGAIGRVFPVLFFLVAALISLTSMTRMVEEQRTSIGTMKALGYGKLSIAAKYMGYALLATVGGSVLGVLVGEKVLPYIIVYAYGILYQHLPEILVPYQWGYAAMASGAAVFCTMLATLLACYKELGAEPAILMRPPSPKNGRRVFAERIGFFWRHLSFTWKSTIRNLMRYKKRFFMTIFGIGGCMALMLVGFGLKDSCYEIAELQYSEIQMYNGSIFLEEDITEEQKAEVDDVLKNDTDVTAYGDVNMQNITLVNGKNERAAYECVFQSTEDAEKFVDFHDRRTKETYHLSDNGVIISEKTAKLLDAEEGDEVWIKDEDEGNKKIRIAHICENYLEHYIYLTPSYYEEVYGEPAEYNSIFFAADDGSGSADLEKLGQKLLKCEGALSVSYVDDIEKQLDDMLRSLNLVIIVLIISAGMLAFVVLYNLNTVNIAERKRELATLKVLGFYDVEVGEYVYRENILLTFIGAAVGVGLGRLLHLFIIETVEVDSAMFGRNINFPSYIYSLLLTIVFSLIVNGVMYFKLKRIDMVESLKSVE